MTWPTVLALPSMHPPVWGTAHIKPHTPPLGWDHTNKHLPWQYCHWPPWMWWGCQRHRLEGREWLAWSFPRPAQLLGSFWVVSGCAQSMASATSHKNGSRFHNFFLVHQVVRRLMQHSPRLGDMQTLAIKVLVLSNLIALCKKFALYVKSACSTD